jgi:hypothetical protein
MKTILLSLSLAMLLQSAHAQMSDFISVRTRKDRNVKTFFPGSFISFTTVDNHHIEGNIDRIAHDSVFLKMYQVQAVPTVFGVTSVDTLGAFDVRLHYKDIRMVDVPRKGSFGFIRNGVIFMIGGIGYTLLNVVNGGFLNESVGSHKNISKIGTAMAVAGGGFVLNRIYVHNQRKGLNYKIVYVRMTDAERQRLKGF